jgi:signal transduction histidine kinase
VKQHLPKQRSQPRSADPVNPTTERLRTITEARAARDGALELEARARFLAEASRVLASSLDFETTLQSVAHLALPRLGDWCIVDVVDDEGQERPVAVASVDGADRDIARRLERSIPTAEDTPCAIPFLGTPSPMAPARQSPESGSVPGVAAFAGPFRRAVLRELGVRAEICVPLLARGRTLGALTLLITTSDRCYGPDDLALAEEVAQRAAVAVDNALLYREAERANAAKAQFLATMSHEFRTPMQTVMGFTELLLLGRPEPIPASARAYAERIASASAHLLQLIDQVLDFSRLDAGRDPVRAERVDIDAFAREMMLLVEPLARAKGIQFLVEAPAPGTVIVTDAGKLRQVCYNLLANAIKFTERGEVTLAATIDEGQLTVEVRDTGVGIPPSDLARIFDAFYQVERPAGEPRIGTGLGLSISQRLVRLLGGELRATSTVDVGTTFAFGLPLVPIPSPRLVHD